MNDPPRLALRSGGKLAASDFDEVTRPDEVIAAEILITFDEAPRHRQAGDVAACK
jgi:hypothetical protein